LSNQKYFFEENSAKIAPFCSYSSKTDFFRRNHPGGYPILTGGRFSETEQKKRWSPSMFCNIKTFDSSPPASQKIFN
jgi:hypothetical protein